MDVLAFFESPVHDIIAVVVIFSVVPNLILRLFVRLYPKRSDRRRELVAELYAVPWLDRPVWVLDQIWLAVREGPRERRADRNGPSRIAALIRSIGAFLDTPSSGDYTVLMSHKDTGHVRVFKFRSGTMYTTKRSGKRYYAGPPATNEILQTYFMEPKNPENTPKALQRFLRP